MGALAGRGQQRATRTRGAAQGAGRPAPPAAPQSHPPAGTRESPAAPQSHPPAGTRESPAAPQSHPPAGTRESPAAPQKNPPAGTRESPAAPQSHPPAGTRESPAAPQKNPPAGTRESPAAPQSHPPAGTRAGPAASHACRTPAPDRRDSPPAQASPGNRELAPSVRFLPSRQGQQPTDVQGGTCISPVHSQQYVRYRKYDTDASSSRASHNANVPFSKNAFPHYIQQKAAVCASCIQKICFCTL
ncbi:proline-rich protein HaeIII subfamily 1-like [Motacilla alba alba]|uniref:proline-rich protein HaeIII subfamily 1-like n=1 Tax=Motacilla alba alba TaxID=1094192 RepID=UPI0018D4DBA5|nr:proline-rich protein HaeIII subfamily 1-like [Motacilla alba alba]